MITQFVTSDTTETFSARLTVSTLRIAPSSTVVTAKKGKVKRITRRYRTPSAMIAASVTNRPTHCAGHSETTAKKRIDSAASSRSPRQTSRRMGAVCCLPQYWLLSTITPFVTP